MEKNMFLPPNLRSFERFFVRSHIHTCICMYKYEHSTTLQSTIVNYWYVDSAKMRRLLIRPHSFHLSIYIALVCLEIHCYFQQRAHANFAAALPIASWLFNMSAGVAPHCNRCHKFKAQDYTHMKYKCIYVKLNIYLW